MRSRTIGAALGAALTVTLACTAPATAQSQAPRHERNQAMQTHMKEMREAHERMMQAHMKEHAMKPDPVYGTGRGQDDPGVGQEQGHADHASPPAESGSPHH